MMTQRRAIEMVVSTILAIAVAFAIAFGFGFALSNKATAKEWGAEQGKYAAPDLQEYYTTLKQPDGGSSCCGDADAYYADKVDTDPDGTLVAIITDTRPDELTRPDGSKVYRVHIDVGTRIRVPANKLRKHAVPNPTDHTIIFLSINEGGAWVYCYEPTGGI